MFAFPLSDYTPHGFCLAWQPGLIWLQAVSDLLTVLAYYSIPAAILVVLARRRDLQFRPVILLFAAAGFWASQLNGYHRAVAAAAETARRPVLGGNAGT